MVHPVSSRLLMMRIVRRHQLVARKPQAPDHLTPSKTPVAAAVAGVVPGQGVGVIRSEPFGSIFRGGLSVRMCEFISSSRCGRATLDHMKLPRTLTSAMSSFGSGETSRFLPVESTQAV